MPFVELNNVIEQEAGASLSEIHSLYGQAAYRRYEMRALERVLREHDSMVLATPGSSGLGAGHLQPAVIALLHGVGADLAGRTHGPRGGPGRYAADAGRNREAVTDLRRILQARAPLYARADLALDTSGQDANTSLQALRARLSPATA
ncbi:shikimate kinase [Cupriavidus basilensis]